MGIKKDKYNAVWVSHSSMGDFIKCPYAYYLHNIYKDPKTGRKINIVNPSLSLGIAVHEVLEGLADFPFDKRFDKPLLEKLIKAWEKVSGKKGGFISQQQEDEVKERAISMINRVDNNREPLLHKTVKMKQGSNGMPPNFYLSEEDNIILCGKVDWLIYRPEDDSVHILDFKTGKNEEDSKSLQLPIYSLLVHNLQKRKINGASYWYIDRDDKPIQVSLPNIEESFERVYSVAKKISEEREKAKKIPPEEVFLCPRGDKGCFSCNPFRKILRGEAEFIGVGEMRQDIYMLRD
jgi:ATP-dependent helicase/DNAse subunit B